MNETPVQIKITDIMPKELKEGSLVAIEKIKERKSVLFSTEFIDVHVLYDRKKNLIHLVNPKDPSLALASLRLLQIALNCAQLSDIITPKLNVLLTKDMPAELFFAEKVGVPVGGKFPRTDFITVHPQEKMKFAPLALKYYEALLEVMEPTLEVRNVVLLHYSAINAERLFDAPTAHIPQKGTVDVRLFNSPAIVPSHRPVPLGRIGAMTR